MAKKAPHHRSSPHEPDAGKPRARHSRGGKPYEDQIKAGEKAAEKPAKKKAKKKTAKKK